MSNPFPQNPQDPFGQPFGAQPGAQPGAQGASSPAPYGQPQAPAYNQAAGYNPVIFSAPKSKAAAAVLAFFLGSFGAHNFYLGFKNKAWWQLGLTIFGIITSIFIIGFLALAVTGIWGFIEFILILVGGGNYRTDAQGQPLG